MPIPLGVLGSSHKAAPGWTPASLATLAGWWDASDAASITSSGGLVSQWADKSGLGHHLTQSSDAAKPTTGSHTQNGRNVLRFNGNGGLSAAAVLTSSTAHTFGIVTTPTTGTNDYLLAITPGYSSQWSIISRYGAAFEHYEARFQIGDYNAAGAHAIIATRNGASVAVTYDGAPGGSSGSGNGDSYTQNMHVGYSGGGDYSTATIAEVVLASTALDSTNIAALAAYLKAKWNTP